MAQPKKRVGKRGVTWYQPVDLGTDPVTGKRIQRRVSAKTKKECEEKARALLARGATTGVAIEPTKERFDAYLYRWLETVASNLAESSYARYRSLIVGHIAPELGRLTLAKVNALAIAEFEQRKLKSLAPATVALIHVVVDAALAQAVRWRLLPENPAALVDPPRVRPPEMAVWTAEQATTFLEATKDEPFGPLWRVLLHTGMRIGEALALRWCDVDLGGREVRITGTITRGKDGIFVVARGRGKTRGSVRAVALTPSCAEALRAERKRQIELALATGARWDEEALVWPGRDGRPHPPNTAYYH